MKAYITDKYGADFQLLAAKRKLKVANLPQEVSSMNASAFHDGELLVQNLANETDIAVINGSVITSKIPPGVDLSVPII